MNMIVYMPKEYVTNSIKDGAQVDVFEGDDEPYNGGKCGLHQIPYHLGRKTKHFLIMDGDTFLITMHFKVVREADSIRTLHLSVLGREQLQDG